MAVNDTMFHSVLDHAIPICNRLEDGLCCNFGPAAGQHFEHHGLKHHVTRFRVAFELEGVDDPLGWQHLMVNAMEPNWLSC